MSASYGQSTMDKLRYYRDELNKSIDKIEGMKVLLNGRRTLSWECSDPDGDSLTYKVYFGTDSTNMYLTSVTKDTFCLSGFQQKAHTYYWQVVAFDQDTFTMGPIWRYSTIADTQQVALFFNEPMDSASLKTEHI